MSVEEKVCENLVWMFYSNMELSAIRKDRVITHVSGVRIEFDAFELSRIIGISSEGLDLYISRKELHFSHFCHLEAVRNICR